LQSRSSRWHRGGQVSQAGLHPGPVQVPDQDPRLRPEPKTGMSSLVHVLLQAGVGYGQKVGKIYLYNEKYFIN